MLFGAAACRTFGYSLITLAKDGLSKLRLDTILNE